MTTDADFLYSVLSDGKPHSTTEILRRSFVERGVGLTVHSRAATLRERGHVIRCFQQRGATYRDRPTFYYVLAASPGEPLVSAATEEESGRSTGAAGGSPGHTNSGRVPLETGSLEPLRASAPALLSPPSRTTSDASAVAPETRPETLFDLPKAPTWA